MSARPALLQIQHLRTAFHGEGGEVTAVDDVSLTLTEGETLGLVGESGSGKSVTSLSVLRLLPERTAAASGSVAFLGKDLLSLSARAMNDLRGAEIAMIFQEPMTSLNPVFRVGDQVAETLIAHQAMSRAEARAQTVALFREVGIPEPERRVDAWPHELSGGQKQRVMIAMALACNPKLLICDEPTTALDVTIQAQILDLLRNLRDERGMAMLFITHDLGIIAEIADRVAVMYRGRLVEVGDVVQVFGAPAHPYTKGLLACKPRLDTAYDVLPTVDDYMEVREEYGQVVLVEKPMPPERLAALTGGGRVRKIHPAGAPLLSVRGLVVQYPGAPGRAVDDVSFDVWPGQTLGLVGESGCGKTTTGRAIVGLLAPQAGEITYQGTSLRDAYAADSRARTVEDLALVAFLVVEVVVLVAGGVFLGGQWVDGGGVAGAIVGLLASVVSVLATARAWTSGALTRSGPKPRSVRADVQIIFQDPYSSLNPRQSVEEILTEPMLVHHIGADAADRQRRAERLLVEVGLKPEHLRRYPHEFSGGQRQRICIARALAVEPRLIICDEAVSALDVSVQAQVLNLLRRLQEAHQLTYLFISHDLSVVKFMSDTMAVMQGGRIVEAGSAEQIYAAPAEEYTRRLIAAVPKDDLAHIQRIQESRRHGRALRQADIS